MSANSEQDARHTLVDEAPPLPELVIRREILDRFSSDVSGQYKSPSTVRNSRERLAAISAMLQL